MIRFAVMTGLCLVSSSAFALDPYMWGIGPRVGTNVLPGSYPVAFPPAITEESNASTIERVRTDVIAGLQATYYVTGRTRMGVVSGVGFGNAFFDAHVMVTYNYVSQTGAMDFLLGGGAGFGASRWTGDSPELLRVPYYPLRAEASALVRDNSRGYQGTLFFQYNLPANHFYTDPTGAEPDIGTGVYPTAGVELTIFFGDFTPPRPRRDSNDSAPKE